jgi:hypothetical protein
MGKTCRKSVGFAVFSYKTDVAFKLARRLFNEHSSAKDEIEKTVIGGRFNEKQPISEEDHRRCFGVGRGSSHWDGQRIYSECAGASRCPRESGDEVCSGPSVSPTLLLPRSGRCCEGPLLSSVSMLAVNLKKDI